MQAPRRSRLPKSAARARSTLTAAPCAAPTIAGRFPWPRIENTKAVEMSECVPLAGFGMEMNNLGIRP